MWGEGSFEILDISQPVSRNSACFPGDTPFQKTVTVSYAQSQVINLTAFTMSPHIGTHADAPCHVQGDIAAGHGIIGEMPLNPYMGPVRVVDVSPCCEEILPERVQPHWEANQPGPKRVLFKTTTAIRYDVFENAYAHFSVPLVTYLANQGVVLMGLDTPSVDEVSSKTLPVHHALLKAHMVWLENLDLTRVEPGDYFLVALPLKLMELEASPVRAVLLKTVKP